MSLSLARQAVDAYLDLLNTAGRRHAEIHFFGGEPFFAEEVVRFVVDYASLRASQFGLTTHFEAITNGFYNANVSKWIADSFDTIILSLDGPPEIQERQRPARNGRATFATVFRNAKIFAAGSSELIIRVCVTSETVAQMTSTAEWLAQELHPSAICFETLVASPLARASKLFPPSPWEFAREFMAASQILTEYGIETVLSTADLQSLQISFCPVGKDALIISPDGMADACYLLQEDWQRNDLNLRFGQVTAHGFELDYPALQRIRNLTVDNKIRCTDCLCRYHCAGGCHVNHPDALTAEKPDDLCIQTRLVTIASLLRRIGQNALAESWLQDQQAQELAVMQALRPVIWRGAAMNPGKNSTFLRSPETVHWVKDRDQVLIINKQQRQSCVLQGVEAILWGWLASAYSYSKILRLLGNLSGTSPAETENSLQIILRKWRLAGLLELEAGEHG